MAMISNSSRRVARRTSGDQPTSEGRDIGRSLPHRGPGRRLQSGAVRRENDRLALEAAEARPVRENIANIVLRLADPGNQASPHPAWSGIVGREREMILPECVQLLAQIARAAPQIALDTLGRASCRERVCTYV